MSALVTTSKHLTGELIKPQPGRKPPRPSINPIQDAVRATSAIATACEHLRNLSGAEPGAWSECLPDIKQEQARLAALVRMLEQQ